MSRTYKATGINLKSMPMGESDRLLTILTREFGLVRAVAMGARKHNSRLGGRSELFVVNDLLMVKGRSLDKVTQAETLESYPGLGQDLKKLIASQYLAELSLCQALSDQPQEDLFDLLNEHLRRLERSPVTQTLARLTHAVFQMLVVAGVAPQVHQCCVTRQTIVPDFSDAAWRIGFSSPAGGTVTLAALEQLLAKKAPVKKVPVKTGPLLGRSPEQLVSDNAMGSFSVSEAGSSQPASTPIPYPQPSTPRFQMPAADGLHMQLTAVELAFLQQLAQEELPETMTDDGNALQVWRSIERIMRHYAQYHFDRSIRSATLIDACFVTAEPLLP